MTNQKVQFDDYYSFLVVLAEDEPISYHVNDQLKNELYVDTFEQLKTSSNPLNVCLTISSIETDMIEQMVMFHNEEALDKVRMVTCDKATFETLFAKYFEE